MLRTKYYLADAKSAGETAPYVACYLQGQRKKICLLTLTVKPEQWAAQAQKCRHSFAGFSDVNHLLKKLAEGLEAAHLQLTARRKVTTAEACATWPPALPRASKPSSQRDCSST